LILYSINFGDVGDWQKDCPPQQLSAFKILLFIISYFLKLRMAKHTKRKWNMPKGVGMTEKVENS
jgi:hypothetical protein